MVFEQHHKVDERDFKLRVIKTKIGFLAEVEYTLHDLEI
jgi:hypothetical protein